MPKYCDRSPCDKLLISLGRFIHGTADKGAWFLTASVVSSDETNVVVESTQIEIVYCPFCGTRLEEMALVEMKRQWFAIKKSRPTEKIVDDSVDEDTETPNEILKDIREKKKSVVSTGLMQKALEMMKKREDKK